MSLDRVDAGERVTFRRRGNVYAVTQMNDAEALAPALEARIRKVRAEYQAGLGVTCRTKDEIAAHINSL